MSEGYIKGRGAQKKVANKFHQFHHQVRDDFLNHCDATGEEPEPLNTRYIEVFPKTFVNKVISPDVGMPYSANPYQGCEHGCIYCYARNTHEFWGYGAGLDFEKNILVKKNAHELLEAQLRSRSWKGEVIVFSGNTDCYQPIERKLQITRRCLEVMLKWNHPVGIITKNALILRDLDILRMLAEKNLVLVNISITSLSESTRRLLEPRTASIAQRLKTVSVLTDAGIPVRVMMAPIIPSLNSHEIIPLMEKVSSLGAFDAVHTMIRLNGQVAEIFSDWIRKALTDKADRILNQIAEVHNGKLNESRWGKRMRGEGVLADQISNTVKLARKKFFKGRKIPELGSEHYLQLKDPQLRLF